MTGPAIILVEPQLGENIGTAARAMANFGLADLRLVNPREGWPNGRAHAAASRADDVIDRVRVFPSTGRGDRRPCLRLCGDGAAAGDRQAGRRPARAAAARMRALAAAGTTAGVLFGRERTGLTNEDISLADEILTLPVDPGFWSLNVAQAVLVFAYEWRLAGFADEAAGLPFASPVDPPAPREELIRFFDQLEGALDAVGFFRPDGEAPAHDAGAPGDAPQGATHRAGGAHASRRGRGSGAAADAAAHPVRRNGDDRAGKVAVSTRLLVFDSGIGGLSVVREIRQALPSAEISYVADDAAFPYGDWGEGALSDHVTALIGRLIGRFTPDAVVVACNTASTLVLPPLRARFATPFVGTVPAIKPAAERTRVGAGERARHLRHHAA